MIFYILIDIGKSKLINRYGVKTKWKSWLEIYRELEDYFMNQDHADFYFNFQFYKIVFCIYFNKNIKFSLHSNFEEFVIIVI